MSAFGYIEVILCSLFPISLLKGPSNILIISDDSLLTIVSCFLSHKIGTVTVINTTSNTVIKDDLYVGHQPHGLIIDETNGLVYVSNRNFDPGGPAPHHATECVGRNGYITAIDMNTLELVPNYKAEVSVDPYAMMLRE